MMTRLQRYEISSNYAVVMALKARACNKFPYISIDFYFTVTSYHKWARPISDATSLEVAQQLLIREMAAFVVSDERGFRNRYFAVRHGQVSLPSMSTRYIAISCTGRVKRKENCRL